MTRSAQCAARAARVCWASAVRPAALRAIAPAITGSEYYEGWTYQGGALQLFAVFWTLFGLLPSTLANLIATNDGTASAPDDYTAAGGTLTFQPGETTKTFTIATAVDSVSDGSESVNLMLSGATSGLVLGSQNTATPTSTYIPRRAVEDLEW